ncbi:MAG: CGNR zinc finger domain-containing protein [Actinomycetota bacterium]
MHDRRPQPVHQGDEVPSAPGDLELVRGFVSLHDHAVADSASLQPVPATLASWLREQALIPVGGELHLDDLAWGLDIRDALITKVLENMGAPADPEASLRLNTAAIETGLRPRFDAPRLDATAEGVRGAIGRILGIAFLAELDGSWHRFRMCADPTCTTVFYDRSKNHSAKWCSMQSCGNRNKVRAFRQRHAQTT